MVTETFKKPRITDILLVFAAMLLYTGSLGGVFTLFTPFWAMSLFTVGIGLAPILYARGRGFELSRSFPLVRPSKAELSGALIMTVGLISLALAATGLITVFLPSGTPGMEHTAAAISEMNAFAAVFAVGLLPALCEEVLFRGFILNGLGGITGKWRAIVITALLFGILHRDPARVPLTAGIGIALGYAAWETRSLALPMVMHGLYNLSLFGISRLAGAAEKVSGAGEPDADLLALAQSPEYLGARIVTAVLFLAPIAAFGFFAVRKGARRLRSACVERLGTEAPDQGACGGPEPGAGESPSPSDDSSSASFPE